MLPELRQGFIDLTSPSGFLLPKQIKLGSEEYIASAIQHPNPNHPDKKDVVALLTPCDQYENRLELILSPEIAILNRIRSGHPHRLKLTPPRTEIFKQALSSLKQKE
jgi:hypothetical protein